MRAGRNVREIVLAVNRFFEPDCSPDENDRLTLWQSHRYDVQAPAAFVALYYESSDGMKVEGPAAWILFTLKRREMQAGMDDARTAVSSTAQPADLRIRARCLADPPPCATISP